ncbi:uncharacterized protein [Panulirus ornatus]|uniref:uncharacterized protein isoform X2 n=1 Tax=Panulirus ornatus TaxID=150431 RepID=UPI003A836C04
MACSCNTNTHLTMHRAVCGVACVALLLLLAAGVVVEAAPSALPDDGQTNLAIFRRSIYGSGPDRRSDTQCSNDAEKQYMCEMCAKETKSLQVYTLCCNGSDDAQTWCQSFLVYGINSV